MAELRKIDTNGNDDMGRCPLYDRAAYQVFEICFKKAGLVIDKNGVLQNDGWSILSEKIKREIGTYPPVGNTTPFDWKYYHNYLRNQFRFAKIELAKADPYHIKNYDNFRLYPVLKYAGIDDHITFNDLFKPTIYADEKPELVTALAGKTNIPDKIDEPMEAINDNTKPIVIPVVCRLKPFGKLSFLRLLDEGHIYFYADASFEYKGAPDNYHINLNEFVKTSECCIIDSHDFLWIKVECRKDGLPMYLYFAEYVIHMNEVKLNHPQNLLHEFAKLAAAKSQTTEALPNPK